MGRRSGFEGFLRTAPHRGAGSGSHCPDSSELMEAP